MQRSLIKLTKDIFYLFSIFLMCLGISCSLKNRDDCACTQMACSDGISVFVRLHSGGVFPEGNYLLHWKTGNLNGNTTPDSIWNRVVSGKDSLVVFYIPRQDVETGHNLQEQKVPFECDFYFNGIKMGQTQAFTPNWTARSCNYCEGDCEDIVHNAEISMLVAL